MPRTMRLERPRYARRRHRSWVRSMMIASVAWGLWWVFFFTLRLNPDAMIAFPFVKWTSFAIATFGLLVALSSLRSARTWLLFVLFPILANASVYLVPWLVADWLGNLSAS